MGILDMAYLMQVAQKNNGDKNDKNYFITNFFFDCIKWLLK